MPKETISLPQFTAQQLDQAHKVGQKAAKELGLPDASSELVVNAVIVHFVRMTAQQVH
jgi:hypothetical protein